MIPNPPNGKAKPRVGSGRAKFAKEVAALVGTSEEGVVG